MDVHSLPPITQSQPCSSISLRGPMSTQISPCLPFCMLPVRKLLLYLILTVKCHCNWPICSIIIHRFMSSLHTLCVKYLPEDIIPPACFCMLMQVPSQVCVTFIKESTHSFYSPWQCTWRHANGDHQYIQWWEWGKKMHRQVHSSHVSIVLWAHSDFNPFD